MKIPKKSKKKSFKLPIFIATGVLFLGVAGVASWYYLAHRHHNAATTTTSSTSATTTSQSQPQATNSVNYNPPTPSEQQQQQDTKSQILQQDQTRNNPPSNAEITVTLSRANQGGTGLPLNIRTIISGTNTGTCTVTLTKDGQPTVTKTFPITFQATYATCQQSDIAASTFSTNGDWALSITASNGTTTSKPATGTVTITK